MWCYVRGFIYHPSVILLLLLARIAVAQCATFEEVPAGVKVPIFSPTSGELAIVLQWEKLDWEGLRVGDFDIGPQRPVPRKVKIEIWPERIDASLGMSLCENWNRIQKFATQETEEMSLVFRWSDGKIFECSGWTPVSFVPGFMHNSGKRHPRDYLVDLACIWNPTKGVIYRSGSRNVSIAEFKNQLTHLSLK